jgi:tetratricopeptide (TPR) repeat protein
MHKLLCSILIALSLLVGGSAFSKGRPPKVAEPAGREVKEREARKACLEGDYVKGVSILSDLFLDSKDASYIYNQGRCYEQNERYQEAIGRFREYMRTPGSEDTPIAQKHIAECEALERKRNPSAVEPGTQPVVQPTATPVAVVPAAPVPAQPTAIVQQSPDVTTIAGSGLRTAGVVTAGIGAAGLITGVVLNLKANSLASSIEPPNTYQRSVESSRKNYQTFSWVGYGVGAAGIVTGAILYGIGWSRGNSTDVALLPAIGPGLAGATVRGAF